jgi:very-short-patch-repair endonuclease
MDRHMHQHRRTHNVPSARELRARETNAESLLWEKLRGRRLNGLKFRRQHPVGPFVLDFCCAECRLAVELDGGVHDQQKERDAEREALLKTGGYRVLRFANDEVMDNIDAVIAAIGLAADSEPLPRPAAPGRDAGW